MSRSNPGAMLASQGFRRAFRPRRQTGLEPSQTSLSLVVANCSLDGAGAQCPPAPAREQPSPERCRQSLASQTLAASPSSCPSRSPPALKDVTDISPFSAPTIPPPCPDLYSREACQQLDCAGQVTSNGSPGTAVPEWGKSLQDSLFRVWPLIPRFVCFLFVCICLFPSSSRAWSWGIYFYRDKRKKKSCVTWCL